MNIAQSFSVLAVVAFITGCASTRAPYVYSTPDGQVISTGPARKGSDVALEEALRAELNRYGDLAEVSPNVQIYSQDGLVTLTGAVRNQRDREMIDALVRNTSGVSGLNDQLQVNYPPTSGYGQAPRVYSSPSAPVVNPPPDVVNPGATVIPGPAAIPQVQAATTSDQVLADRIVDRLRWDSVPTSWLQNAAIRVNNGDVYFQGDVDDAREHRAILSSLQHTAGVRNIYDECRVR